MFHGHSVIFPASPPVLLRHETQRKVVIGYSACSPVGAVSGRNHTETCAGCIVSLTTPNKSLLRASRSVSFFNLVEKASRVFLVGSF
jgi:hypothetical protein